MQEQYVSTDSDEQYVDFPEIKGVDVRAGIKRMGGRTDLYKRLLKGFCHDYNHFDKYMDELLLQNDEQTITRTLHSLKGIVGTMEAQNLYELSIKTEKAWKEKDKEFDRLLRKLKLEISNFIKLLKSLEMEC